MAPTEHESGPPIDVSSVDSGELERLEELVRQRAFLHEDPVAYLRGVSAAFEALRDGPDWAD